MDEEILLAEGMEQLAQQSIAIKDDVYDDVKIGEFVTIKESSKVHLPNYYGQMESFGRTDDGLIGYDTTTIETVSKTISFKKSEHEMIAKSDIWTIQELERCKESGIALDDIKLKNLRANVFRIVDRSGFIGHPKANHLNGLLNSKDVSIDSEKLAAIKMDEIDANEFIKLMVRLFIDAYERSHGTLYPNTIALDSSVFSQLAGTLLTTATGGFVSASRVLNETLSDIAGFRVEIKAIPHRFALKVAGKNKGRIVVYHNSADNLFFDLGMLPTLIPPQPKDLLGIQAGYRASVGSVCILNKESIIYYDYKTAPKS